MGVVLLPQMAAAANPTAREAATPSTPALSHPLLALASGETRDLRHVATLYPRRDFGGTASALDCEHAVHDITLDPATGKTSAKLDLRVHANRHSLSRVGFTFDAGLGITSVTATDRDVKVTQSIVTPTRVTEIELVPALAPGEVATIHVEYAGTLACGSFNDGGGLLCTRNADFQFFGQQSVYPYVFDPEAPTSMEIDTLTRDITLRVPSSIDVVATGEHIEDTTENGMRVSRWTIDRPLARSLGLFVFTGKLGRLDVAGRSVPTTMVFPAPQLPIDERMRGWSSPVLDFVEQTAQTRLPFERSLTLVRLPADVGDPGTATFGMTLLSEQYARAGELMHEETWAHENSHLFWGIVVPERNPEQSRLMTEGLATLDQIDYTGARHFATDDRDLYLARRFVPIGIDLRTMGKMLPPVVWENGGWPIRDSRVVEYTVWGYTKSAAVLDHLRVSIGEDVFARALDIYRQQCSYVGCTPNDFRVVLEKATGADMRPFFDRWMTNTTRPAVTIGFAVVPGGADVELTKDDEAPMSLELWLRLDDGQRIKRRVELRGRTTTLRIDTPAGVRSVSTNPRHDLMVDARSVVKNDLDFDGEVDGADLLRCSRQVGRVAQGGSGLGLWTTDETFDTRCDVNEDLRIDDADIELLSRSFGTLKKEATK